MAGSRERRHHRPLVLVVQVGEQQADGHRLGTGVSYSLGQLDQRAGGQRLNHLAPRIQALRHLEAQLLGDEGHHRVRLEGIQIPSGPAAEGQEIGKAGRGNERRSRALAFEQGVRRHGRAVDNRPILVRARGLQGLQHRPGWVVRSGQALGDLPAIGAQEHQIGIGATDVNANTGGAGMTGARKVCHRSSR